MHFMSRVTNPKQSEQGIDLNINRATKLMRLHNETVEALSKYRRKGEQKVTVIHKNQQVNVNGGQAIVNEFNPGSGDQDKK